MSRIGLVVGGIAAVYFLFYLGGSYSFRYTHVCAHSHKHVVYSETQNASTQRTLIVCDRYAGNARRWSFGDPVRAFSTERLTRYDGMGIGLLVLVIGAAAFFERRRRRKRRVTHAAAKT